MSGINDSEALIAALTTATLALCYRVGGPKPSDEEVEMAIGAATSVMSDVNPMKETLAVTVRRVVAEL